MKTVLALACLASAATAHAQTHDVAALRDAALQDQYALEITEGLTTEIGPRLAGTEAEARARTWAVAKLTALGFSNVRVESFDMPVWVRGDEKAWVTAPFPQPLAVTALGNSGATPASGIQGEIVAFESVDALIAAPDSAVRGKIVFIDHAMPPTQDGSSYGAFGRPRREGPTIASRKGAVGIVVRSIGTDSHRNPHTGVQTFADGAKPIPAGALSNPDADQLKRILKRGRPVKLKLVLTPRNIGIRQSGNVIAEVPGRDRSLPPVLVGGHLDSWDLGTGAVDDASGVAITAAAAKRIMDAGQPLRTIRVVWFGAEEVGLFGGLDYRAKHGKEPHYAIAESDFGADKVWQVNTKLGMAREGEAKALQQALAPLGIVPGSLTEADGSDIGPMIADGVPAIALSQDGTHYFDLHHTPDDTFDKIDPAAMRQNVAAWTAMLAIVANTPAK
ncbi:M20/M25/M40 family metallo-hydrolase [Sphingomonas piscis]|uniref:Carboxypeptidase Q n=1 Tax=Sphingomonas piscis TaxID=2714943 RepID=A0A6G7YLN1_9SPHN|nr:M20/M25/M40 family metallo-hydrolase [Sphingomonas piscis]QIK77616.1 M20/M25/M40 family metallo-hydrolase [Sphingomonas piscis]